MTQEQKDRAAQTRHELEQRRFRAQAQDAERKAEIMAALSTVATRPDATTEQILEAARLAVELHENRY